MHTISLDTFHSHVVPNLMEHIFPASHISHAVTCASLFNSRLHTTAVMAGSIFTFFDERNNNDAAAHGKPRFGKICSVEC